MMRPFEGFDWGAMALLSKAPQWSDADYQMHAERLQARLLLPAEYLAEALADPLAERLGFGPFDTSVRPLGVGDGFVDFTLLTFRFEAGAIAGLDGWLRLRIGHDTVGFACGARLDRPTFDAWKQDVRTQLAITGALAHHPTLSVVGFVPEAEPPVPPPRRPTPFAAPPPPLSPALVGPMADREVRIGWHDPLPPTSTLPRFVPFCLDRLSEFAPLLGHLARLRSKGTA